MDANEIAKVTDEFKTLQSTGHAVILDETHDSKGKIERVCIHHYLTCEQCKIVGRRLDINRP